MTIAYKLYKGSDRSQEEKQTYTYTQLTRMTTYQLKEICIKEKLVKNRLGELSRDELIHLIMNYRGAKDVSLICEREDTGRARIEVLLKNTKMNLLYEQSLKVPSKIKVYEQISIGTYDQYKVTADIPLSEGNVLIVDEGYNVLGILNLIQKEEGYYLVKDRTLPTYEAQRGHPYLLYFESKMSEVLYETYYNKDTILPRELCCYRIPLLEFKVQAVPVSEEALIIDFGTSNTTLGIYDENQGIRAVTYQGESLIPSVIATKAITGEKIEYVFGHEAVALGESNYIKEGIHVFYDIKRWISDAERLEKITSEEGEHTFIKRKELLKAYFEYLIALANDHFKVRFKTLTFLTPIRYKEKFEQLLQSLLTEYNLNVALDEGVAVLFNTLSHVIQQDQYIPNRVYKALILDCGGGTTDLTACKFKINNNRVAYHIEMETSYENGDANFGGNNLTYRIMQFLKVNIVKAIHSKMSLDLECLEKDYEAAEQILPTKFKQYETSSISEYFKVKQNFYHLFTLAEQLKKHFFTSKPFYEITLGLQSHKQEDSRKGYMLMDKWKLSVCKQGELETLLSLPDITLYRDEIFSVLRADVYLLIQKLLEPFYEEGELMNYQIIKLTGQSCQVELFREALKEFIPGKLLNYKKEDKAEEELKLASLYGALKYHRKIKLGYVELEHSYAGVAFPYEITSYTHEQREKILISSLQKEETIGHISRFKDGSTLQIYLKDIQGKCLRNYEYAYEKTDFIETTYYQIEEAYKGKISQMETDNIENEEIKFFVWIDPIRWGFNVLPILRENESLYEGKLTFFDFENDTWEENFFDGTK